MSFVERSREFCYVDPESNFTLDYAGMKVEKSDFAAMSDKFAAAAVEMKKIEAGEIKNIDEKRKVTHFTDRIAYAGSPFFAEVEAFAEKVRSGEIKGSTGKKFDAVVVNGIGGSALGPQLMQFAINGPYWNELSDEQRRGYLKIYFLDNTDSAELVDLLNVMDMESTLHLVVSKSGGTQETKNNMIVMNDLYRAAGLDFARHAAAVTMKGSELDKFARSSNFLAVFEMAESIGGRTSETSIVGHVPAALTGVDFAAFLKGACHMDELTRSENYCENPAMLLSALWYIAGKGKGDRNMVIVPYSDRLVLLSRYLQQLVMESLGKELDRNGNVVHQGLNVFGNKGGTDAHAFIQQLNDGRDDLFVTFIEILKDAGRYPVTDGFVIGDYLHGFRVGLSDALRGKGRQVINIQLEKLGVYELGMIIALYERAVALYAEYININAFHQPGVQAYKLAAKSILKTQSEFMAAAEKISGFEGDAAEIAAKAGMPDKVLEIAGLLDKAAANCDCVQRCYDEKKGGFVYRIK